jgi:hypothetical protein
MEWCVRHDSQVQVIRVTRVGADAKVPAERSVRLFHGTSWASAKKIERDGYFIPSVAGNCQAKNAQVKVAWWKSS